MKDDVGLTDLCFRGVVGTWNTIFEKSAWGGVSQTINTLVLVTTDADEDSLEICGDRRGRCADGEFGSYKWIGVETAVGHDPYVLAGLAQIRRDFGATELVIGSPCIVEEIPN